MLDLGLLHPAHIDQLREAERIKLCAALTKNSALRLITIHNLTINPSRFFGFFKNGTLLEKAVSVLVLVLVLVDIKRPRELEE